MARQSYNSAVQVDWFNVSYRSVYTIVIAAVLVVGGGAGFWYYRTVHQPRAAATQAIDEATTSYRQASQYGGVEGLGDTLDRAGDALDEARMSFDEGRFPDAQFAALHSQDLSRKIVQMAGGGEDSGNHVRFNQLEGDVRVKRAGEFSWESADARMALQIGDQVKTSSSASAQIIYFDGTKTTIEPGSLLEIKELYEDPVTKVRRVHERLAFGQVNASIADRNVAGSFHEVSTAKVAARAEGESEFQVAYDGNQRTSRVDVFTGKLEVQGSDRAESLQGGERIRAAADGRLGSRQALPGVPRLRSPADQRVFVFTDSVEPKVTLSWEQLAGNDGYRLMIAGRQLFTDPLFDGRRKGGSSTLEGLSEGTYFWRVAALRGETQGPFSEVRTFRVSSQRIQDRSDTTPPALEVNDFVSVGGMVIVNGRSEPGATLWIDNEKIDVYDDGSFNAVIRLQQDGLNEIVFLAQDNAGNETRFKRSIFVEGY